MVYPKISPVENDEILRSRILDFFRSTENLANRTRENKKSPQLTFDEYFPKTNGSKLLTPRNSITYFLDFISGILIDHDIYLFGGLIRDLAIFGKKGFCSDIDVVVDGEITDLIPLLEDYDARKNKFGGYRLTIGNWPVDIWQADETWAFKKGYIKYKGIASLTDTTVLNWDGILMNWRTKNFIHNLKYFEDINNRSLDIVFEKNPNPLGMLIRVLRHLRHKDATKISLSAVKYLILVTNKYIYKDIHQAEFKSYGNSLIDENLFILFASLNDKTEKEVKEIFSTCKNEAQNKIRDKLIGQVQLF